jgi:nucleoside-diphosphate-sugar epimerase
MAKLVIGCGYLGQRVAERWRRQGHEVFAVTRSQQHAVKFAGAGLTPVIADVMKLETLVGLPAAETVLYSVGYDSNQGHSIEEVYLLGLMNALNALPAETGRVIYISSTGVYGDADGEWIDEASPCNPDRAGGRACLSAEEALLSHSQGKNSIILRMAGIYGPNRIPRREAFNSGRPMAVVPTNWLNLIHVDDAASVVLAAEKATQAPRTYVVSDGSPVARGEYYTELARLHGAPAPRFLTADQTWPGPVRASNNKRINTARMKAELDVRMAFPTYREGLESITATNRTIGG